MGALMGVVMQKVKISAKKMVRDIEDGVGDYALMEKYRLTAKQLEKVLRALVQADLITHMQLYERTTLSESQITRALMEEEAQAAEDLAG